MVSTQGELFLDLSKYLAIDGVILTIFAVVAMIISKLVCDSKRFGIYLFVYYYFLFAVFSDGHVVGWSHSATIFDKFAVFLFQNRKPCPKGKVMNQRFHRLTFSIISAQGGCN